ncbi:porin [Methylibium petroleiphilum]|uniref:porin n=1 Tax=Methylibium petroleiphilum TaxID=105560 RepID=UPI001AC599E7|nr:porin [Methylibium petroleiphilum]MBN9205082.1 porin [Methylibium petroleiphilum]
MKKLALAAALCAAFTGSAFAQSSVTLYGRLNTSIEFQDNDVSDATVMKNNASRWGLRGSEDLGGGTSAFFQLESGFGSDDGTGTGGFGRDAYVGLKSATLGQIKLGKIALGALYGSTIDYIGVFNHDTGTTSEDNIYSLRVGFSNAVEYTSPNFGPVSFAVTVAAGEGTGPKTYEGVVNYDVDGLHIGAGYSKSEDQFGNDTIKGFSAGAAYTMGPFLLGLAYENSDDAVLGKRNQVTGTVQYTVGASEFHVSVGWADEWDNLADSDAIQYTLGYNYNLSKRTKVYAFYYAIDNNSFPYGGSGTATLPVLADNKFSSIGLGIRHNF